MPDSKNAPKVYTVRHDFFGPYAKGQSFSTDEFAVLHDVPPRSAKDPDAYHAGLIDRAIGLGAIVAAPANVEPTPAPIGPENDGTRTGEAVKPVPAVAGGPAKPNEGVKPADAPPAKK